MYPPGAVGDARAQQACTLKFTPGTTEVLLSPSVAAPGSEARCVAVLGAFLAGTTKELAISAPGRTAFDLVELAIGAYCGAKAVVVLVSAGGAANLE